MATIDDLRARCPNCYREVHVKRTARGLWRMVLHDDGRGGVYRKSDSCPVRDVDAKPLVQAWVDDFLRVEARGTSGAAYNRAEAAKLLVEADKHEESARVAARNFALLSPLLRTP